MKLAAAQTIPRDGDIEANIADHVRLTKQAASDGAQLILFPEMSLTGYVREGAADLAFAVDDARLIKLKEISRQENITIIAGAPVQINTMLCISAFIICPDGNTILYTKQYLHEGEEKFFSASDKYNPTLTIEQEVFSFAICADIANPIHVVNAKQSGATFYLTSLFYTANGIQEGCEQLCNYAKQHSIQVLMANYSGSSYNLKPGGKSAYWNKDGELVNQLDNTNEGLLIVTI